MSFNNQGVVSIENQENYENKVISSQNSDSSSSSKRKPKLLSKDKLKTSDKQLFSTPSSTESTISTQSDRIESVNDSSLDLQVRLDETLKYVLSKDFGVDTEAEFILFEKEQEIKQLEKRVAELKQDINKK